MKIKNHIGELILSIYLSFVTFAFLYVNVSVNLLKVCLITIVLGCLYFILGIYLFRFLKKIKLAAPADLSAGKLIRIFAIFFFATLAVMMIWYTTYFPGCFGSDSLAQYEQVLKHTYSDWHPAWHTLLFFALPLKLTGGASWSIILFQIIYFSLTAGYICMVIYKYSGIRFALISFIYMILNPYTGYLVMYPYKDVAFAIAGALCAAMGAQIYLSKGEWADKWYRGVILGIMFAQATIFRHNGILFTGVLLVAIFFIMDHKKWLIVLTSCIVVMLIIKGPIYRHFDVDTSPAPVMQLVGVPMTVIQHVVAQSPEKLDDEIRDFAYRIAPQEVWEKYDLLGNFCLMRYSGEINEQAIEDEGVASIIEFGINCFEYAPTEAFRALFAVTDVVYGPNITDEGFISYGSWGNEFGLETSVNEKMSAVLTGYYDLILMKGYNFTRQTAFALIMMLASVLAVCRISIAEDRKLILLCLPVFAYNFGTMLFLFWAESRFFYITYLVCPIVLLMLYGKRQIVYNDRV